MSANYCFAHPFPHIAIDNFLPADSIKELGAHFPTEKLDNDAILDMGYAGHHKRQILPSACDRFCRRSFDFFNSQPLIEFLEGLTAIDGLLPDPNFFGGSFHETGRGGKLGIHAYFRINNKLHVSRRMNVIVYLNEDWLEEHNGSLKIWSRDMTTKVKTVAPIWNRCVIFNTDADSYHGHPDPLTVPEGKMRRSLAPYYYTASKTIYEEVPNCSTVYAARPDDDFGFQREEKILRRKQYLSEWAPPAVLRYYRGALRRIKRLILSQT